MAESIFLLTLAGLLLVVVPQFAGWTVASYGLRSGRWWPVLLAVPVAALCFVALAQGFYSPGSVSALQGDTGSGRIVVEQVRTGALVHAAAALVLQVGRLMTGR